MPRKKPGYTFVLIEFPDDLLAAVRAQAGGESLIAFVCGHMADVTGVAYTPAQRGNPNLLRKKKPARKGKPKK